MKVVILCGGKGTRLREATEAKPKPLVEIGERPIVWHIMKTYSHFGFTEFILCLGYKSQSIKEYFLNYRALNNDVTVDLGGKVHVHNANSEEDSWKVTLVDTGLETSTAGRIRRVRDFIGDETFMATYSDGVGDVDIDALLAEHRRHGLTATLTSVQLPSRFGLVEADENNIVREFREKPMMNEWLNAGFFVLEPAIFDNLRDDVMLENEPMHDLAACGQLAMYRHHGFWHPMDTYRDYLYLNGLWEQDQAPWKVWPSSQSFGARKAGQVP
jgi:glucose-1-phosphate cytidylyltransferase